MGIVIKSRVKGQEHWQGKGWASKQTQPRIYNSIAEAAEALENYWGERNKELGWDYDKRAIIFKHNKH